ncbi:hypothetical protein KY290_036592 [Solanum tuberosum]|uniref:Uncharacterized protein n=1 Tax=Solanum tuberosum TaxID=4113 RepID=A0ABQ7TT38_SOLTU|nr:hypothetical protein KY289_036082 [Solanum tuberosum]KAH0639331.1 hypothetical protein KY285_035917 [Solanum tuberosum]KAH0737887.1 hypothetical protein KY290_036592 [Solanum tuberosum]
MKELMMKLPQGPDESLSRPAYTCLTKPHGELSISYSKMKKKEKSCEKFFTRMWKGPLRTLRPVEEGEKLAAWSNDGGADYSKATDSDGDD